MCWAQLELEGLPMQLYSFIPSDSCNPVLHSCCAVDQYSGSSLWSWTRGVLPACRLSSGYASLYICLPRCLCACPLSVAQWHTTHLLDAPHYGEQDGAAAQDVDKVEDVAPRQPVTDGGRLLLRDHQRQVGKDLGGVRV